MHTVYEMFAESAKFFSAKAAVVFVDGNGMESSYSYADILRRADILADELWLNCKKGDRVCLCLPNSPEFIISHLALSKIGAVPVFLHPALSKENVAKRMSDTSSVLLIDTDSFYQLMGSALRNAGIQGKAPRMKMFPNDTVAILYSSGTTGEQKGAELTLKNISSNIFYTSGLLPMLPQDKLMCFLPLTHCFGLNFIMGACFYMGATLILHSSFDANAVLLSTKRNEVTFFFGAPPVYLKYLAERADPSYFSSVRFFFYAAAPLSENALLEWEKKYGLRIYTGWGLTETSPFATYNSPSGYRLGSVGKPIPGVQVKILENGENCGEICVKGHNVMKGYCGLPEETASAIDKEGWFHTGDAGHIDGDGYLFITDRIKDMINVGGEKAWPAEIEKIILTHPAVADAAVIGVPHEIMGEVPKAFVVLKTSGATAGSILDFIKPLLLKHQLPRTIEIAKSLPRNPSGKILKRELRGR